MIWFNCQPVEKADKESHSCTNYKTPKQVLVSMQVADSLCEKIMVVRLPVNWLNWGENLPL